MNIRVSAKALIIVDSKILTLENRAGNLFYTLPGGGQKAGETLIQAVKRECLEEISVNVEVGDLIFVRDYIADNHEFAKMHPGFQQVELIFACTIPGGQKILAGPIPDKDQIGLAWLPIRELAKYPLFPLHLIPLIIARDRGEKVPMYVGDVN